MPLDISSYFSAVFYNSSALDPARNYNSDVILAIYDLYVKSTLNT